MNEKFLEGFHKIQKEKLLKMIENKVSNQRSVILKEIKQHLEDGVEKVDFKDLV
jgi:hypothetical protein